MRDSSSDVWMSHSAGTLFIADPNTMAILLLIIRHSAKLIVGEVAVNAIFFYL